MTQPFEITRRQDARGLAPEDSDALMQELSSLFKTMSERGNGAALDKPFSSPYHWAGFQVRLDHPSTRLANRYAILD